MNTFIIGSCSVEKKSFFSKLALDLSNLFKPYSVDFYLKGSFDKANRSSIKGNRGPGLKKAIKIFQHVKDKNPGIKLSTDVHEVWQVEKLVNIIDCVQVPAFLCRQTDLLTECAKHFSIVNIKVGQWMSPQNMCKGIDKLKTINSNCKVWATVRGTQLGYHQLVVDFSSVDILNKVFDKVILDCTHSTQRLKSSGFTGGDAVLGKRHMLAAPIYGFDGVFAETHYTPEISYSDADSVINFRDIKPILHSLCKKDYDVLVGSLR